MGISQFSWRGLGRAAAICAGASVLASCGNGPVTPAPVEMRGAILGAGGMAEPRPIAPSRAGPARREARYVTIRAGQSLGGIAQSYRVSEREIIGANHLRPPYKLAEGMRLVIPGAGAPAAAPPVEHVAILPPAVPERLPIGHPPEAIPLDGLLPPKAGASALPRPAVPSPAAAEVAAEVAHETAHAPARLTPPKPAAPDEEERADASPAPAVHGGRFPWPVQGRVLAGYGTGAGGAHNDGINIAAARGTPIKAIEGGVVAYAGNELRGYGNLVLIKHPDGLISAYAHCDELLVKKGEQIRPGQVLGRVGASGGVAEPQLHFELRRGKQPVDPRQFLAPGPSAGAEGNRRG